MEKASATSLSSACQCVLNARVGLVTAPAGCGKTHLLAELLRSTSGDRPVLVLTHTNAGVCALRRRLQKASVPPAIYRLSTIDGWALKLASMFPERSGISSSALSLADPETDYPQIREAAVRLLKGGHISDCLVASYSRLFVDEYQDCSVRQHALICHAAAVLPTCVMGDHMQAIFGLSSEEPLVAWTDVGAFFPCILELSRPWRWINAGCQPLGEWLNVVRQKLEANDPLDLRKVPGQVKWVELKGDDSDHVRILNAAKWTGRGSGDGVLIIGDSRNAGSRHWLASAVSGAVVVEPVELKQMVEFFRTFRLADAAALDQLLTFCDGLMVGLGRPQLLKRVESVKNGTARKGPSEIEKAAIAFDTLRTGEAAADVLMALKANPEIRVYRPTVLQGCIRSLLNASSPLGLYQSAISIREQFRSFGRPLPTRAVGSTLLLKGLEAGAAVITNADTLDARNLYVALTRGAKAVVVCSPTPILNPQL